MWKQDRSSAASTRTWPPGWRSWSPSSRTAGWGALNSGSGPWSSAPRPRSPSLRPRTGRCLRQAGTQRARVRRACLQMVMLLWLCCGPLSSSCAVTDICGSSTNGRPGGVDLRCEIQVFSRVGDIGPSDTPITTKLKMKKETRVRNTTQCGFHITKAWINLQETRTNQAYPFKITR